MIFLKKLPVQLLICFVIAMIFGDFFSLTAVQFFYALSFLFKSLLVFILPIMIFTFISCAILSLESKAPLLLFSLLGMVMISNIIALSFSYGIGTTLLPWIKIAGDASLQKSGQVLPLFAIYFPRWLGTDKALFIGIVFGLFFTFFPQKAVIERCLKMRTVVITVLKKAVIPFLPIYVFGFLLKLHREGAITTMISTLGQVFLLIICVIFGYILFLYALGNRFHFSKIKESVVNMIPAAMTGFSTLSSMATMPVTLSGTEKNTQNPQFAQLVIPASANNHMLGSSIGITLLGMASMIFFGSNLPEWSTYVVFMGYFCLAALSAAGVPGGCIVVILPVMEKNLGLSLEMAALVTALYMLMEPFFTAGNVTGNGAFALISQYICRRLKLIPEKSQHLSEEKIDSA